MENEFVPQNTVQWDLERRGKITSSKMSIIMSEPKSKSDKEAGKLSEAAKGYMLDLIAAELVEPNTPYQGDAVQWGLTYESLARDHYSKKLGLPIESCGFIQPDENIFYGGSPDGVFNFHEGWPDEYKNQCGIVEIKCPYETSIHLEYCLMKVDDLPKNHYWQCMSNMNVSNAVLCDFVSFDPRIDDQIGLFSLRIYRNQDHINLMNHKIKLALEYKEQVKKQLGLI